MATRSFKDNSIVLIKAAAFVFHSEDYALQKGALPHVSANRIIGNALPGSLTALGSNVMFYTLNKNNDRRIYL